ncbi:bulb-type lectin domain-containing protein [Tanacetum coccineum]
MEMLEWFYLDFMKQDVLGELPPVIGVIKIDLLGLYKFVDDLGGYMNVSLDNKWNEIAKLLGLAQENQEAVKECYKEYIGMVKIYYEEAKSEAVEKARKGSARRERLRRIMSKLRATLIGQQTTMEKNTHQAVTTLLSSLEEKESRTMEAFNIQELGGRCRLLNVPWSLESGCLVVQLRYDLVERMLLMGD